MSRYSAPSPVQQQPESEQPCGSCRLAGYFLVIMTLLLAWSVWLTQAAGAADAARAPVSSMPEAQSFEYVAPARGSEAAALPEHIPAF